MFSRFSKCSEPRKYLGVAAEILDRFVRDGLLTADEIHTASQRFKKALS